jgi:hypothetical protein
MSAPSPAKYLNPTIRRGICFGQASKSKSKAEEEEEDDDTYDKDLHVDEDGRYIVGAPVEMDLTGNKNDYRQCRITKVNEDGTYDVKGPAPVNIQTSVSTKEDKLVPRGWFGKRQDGYGEYKFENLSDDEQDDWKSESDDDGQRDAKSSSAIELPYHLKNRIMELLENANGSEQHLLGILQYIEESKEFSVFHEFDELCRTVKAVAQKGAVTVRPAEEETAAELPDSEPLVMLNLLYAPRRSRLHSLSQTLARIENLSHIVAWTKSKNLLPAIRRRASVDGALSGCPPIDLVELPRLKLVFTAKPDHTGVMHLYSIDHADLYISNERNAMTSPMLEGIPHSLLMSNMQHEVRRSVLASPLASPRLASPPMLLHLGPLAADVGFGSRCSTCETCDWWTTVFNAPCAGSEQRAVELRPRATVLSVPRARLAVVLADQRD